MEYDAQPGGGPGRLLALALELAAEGVTGRAAVEALAGAGQGSLDAVARARRDCLVLADGGYPYAARAATLLAMAAHPSVAELWEPPVLSVVGTGGASPFVRRHRPARCRTGGLGRLRRI